MTDDSGGPSRRSVLQLTGMSLAGLMGVSGAASAQPRSDRSHGRGRGAPEQANAPAWLERDGNHVGLAVSKREWQSVDASDVEGIPDTARRVPYEALQVQVDGTNEAIEDGYLRVGAQNSHVALERTGRSAFDDLEGEE